MDEWVPNDRRQAATIDRLRRLVGRAAGDYFRDACQIMEATPPLGATTHLVGHLLRELEGMLLGVLDPMAENVPPQGTENRQAIRMNAIADALGIPTDDPIRKDLTWFPGEPVKWAHRSSLASPRPPGPAFEEFWDRAQAVISELTRRLEQSFGNALAAIDEIADAEPDVKRLSESISHSTVAMHRFFSKADLSWFEPLRKAGYFADPPEPVVVDDSVSYQRWPTGVFLVRAAKAYPAEVLSLAQGLETENPEAHESFVDAALEVEAAVAATMVPDVARWLGARFTWGLPFKVRDLIAHLAEGGEIEAATALMDALLRSAGRDDSYIVGELTEELLAAMFPASGLAGLDVLLQRLEGLVGEDLVGDSDHSRIWRPDIANDRRRDPRDQMVSAVRRAAQLLIDADTMLLGPTLELLEARTFSIFKRLSLDLLVSDVDAKLAETRLTNKALFDDYNVAPEYGALAQAAFNSISEEGQDQILAWVESPERDFDNDEQRRGWQRFKLAQLGDPPGAWRERLADLMAEPEPETGQQPPILRDGWVGPNSPRSIEDLAAMDPGDLLDWLGNWEPEPEFGGPSPEGLARNLSAVVKANPEPYALVAPRFAAADPTYARALVSGLLGALKEDKTFSWPPVVELAVASLEKPRLVEGRDEHDWDRDAGWVGTWREVLRLLTAGLDRDELGTEEEKGVWEVVSRLCADPDPASDDREFGDSPVTGSLNSTRPIALRAVIGLALWRQRQQSAEALGEDIAAVLDDHLDPTKDPSPAVRSIYGQLFTALVSLDQGWAARNTQTIFGTDALGEVAWAAYLHSNYPGADTYPLLRDRYRTHLARLEAPVDASGDPGADGVDRPDSFLGDVDEAFVHHLMGLFMGHVVDFGGDSLLDAFYETASLKLRAEALDSLGLAISEEEEGALSDELCARLYTFLDRRLEAAQGSGELAELKGFSWWFKSSALDAEWQLDRLGTLLEAGVDLEPDHVVAERLTDLSVKYPEDAARLLKAQLRAGVRTWFVAGARESIEKILVAALAAGGDAEVHARETVHILLSQGHSDYEELLGN